MTAKIFSIANMKGGVGKTTVAVALARMFARGANDGAYRRVLLIDLDAQANASFWICGDAKLTELIESGKTIDAFLEDSVVLNQARELKDYVHTTEHAGERISIIPSSPELRLIEREMIYFLSDKRKSMREVERIVGELFMAELEKLRQSYDAIVFDSAPGISALTEAALRASDIVIVPTVPDFISNLGLEAFCKSVWWANRDGNEMQQTPWVLANMVKRTAHHEAMLREMRAEAAAADAGFKMFSVEIPDLESIEEAAAMVNGAAAAAFTPEAAHLFQILASEAVEVANAATH